MMKVPFFTSTRDYIYHKDEYNEKIQKVLEKGDFILGSDVGEFEKEITKYNNIKFAVGVANGSDALVLASDILGFKQGAEVLTPVFTFFASASCLVRTGAKPVFCDVDEESFCMDMSDAANKVSKKTKGILPVHLFLQTADMASCMKIANAFGLSVLEDAAEAFGMKTSIDGKDYGAGGIGNAGVYSFFPTKTLGGYGDGGMIVTNDEMIHNMARSLRVHGSVKKYHHDYIGYNSRLDTLQAAILRVKLANIDKAIEKRETLAKQYISLLSGVEQIILPMVKKGNYPVYYVFTIKAQNRNGLNEHLQKNGIGTSIYYPVPLHLQKCFSYLGYKKGDFPVAEKLCDQVLALPMYPELTEDEVSYTCEKIKEFYKL